MLKLSFLLKLKANFFKIYILLVFQLFSWLIKKLIKCKLDWDRCITKAIRNKLENNRIIVDYNKITDYVRGGLKFKTLDHIYKAAKAIIEALKKDKNY